MVFLHALPFGGQMWHAEVDRETQPAFAPTLYGFGETLQEWAKGVLDLVGTEPFIAVGCSIGGSCALEIAVAAPDQVAGIVLIGAKAGVRADPVFRDAAIRMLETQGMDAAWTKYWQPLFGRSASAEVVAAARRMALEHDVADVVRGVRAFHNRRDLTDIASKLSRRLVVISGDQDLTPPPAATKALTVGPDRRFHNVEECGHYVNLERPALFQRLLDDSVEWITSRS